MYIVVIIYSIIRVFFVLEWGLNFMFLLDKDLNFNFFLEYWFNFELVDGVLVVFFCENEFLNDCCFFLVGDIFVGFIWLL